MYAHKPELNAPIPEKLSTISKIGIGLLLLVIILLTLASYFRGVTTEYEIDKNFSTKDKIFSYGTISCNKFGWFGNNCEIKNITIGKTTISTIDIYSPQHIFFGKKGSYVLELIGIQGEDIDPNALMKTLRKDGSFDLPFEVESTSSSQWGRTMEIYIPLLKTR